MTLKKLQGVTLLEILLVMAGKYYQEKITWMDFFIVC